jgi:hypothetical protein
VLARKKKKIVGRARAHDASRAMRAGARPCLLPLGLRTWDGVPDVCQAERGRR